MTARSAQHRPRLTHEQVERAKRLSDVHPRGTVAEMLGVSPATLLAAEKRGWKPARGPRRKIPSDWGLVAPGKAIPELAAHYHASQTTVHRWFNEKPVERAHNGGVHWTPPADFADLLARHSVAEVARRLGVHWNTVQVARKRLGLHPDQIAARTSTGWVERYAAAHRNFQPSKGAHHHG